MQNEETPEDETLNEMPVEYTELTYPPENEQAYTGFSPLIVKEILNHITLGCNLADCAHIVKLPAQRVSNWYNTNYHNFKFAVDYCLADHKRRLLTNIIKSDNALKVSSAKFLLERKYRDEYGKELKIDFNSVMIDNVTKVVFDLSVKYIKDQEILKLFVEELADKLGSIKPTTGIDTQKLIT